MTKSILLQGVTPDSHLDAIKYILGIVHPEQIILSVAFMTESGLSILQEALAPVAKKTTVVTGIRNEITSAQGLRKSLEIGCSTYAVDTGSRMIVFHPKIYLSRNAYEARLVVGSANLTIGGLNSNIEASVLMTMDLNKSEDADFVTNLEEKIDGMIAEYNENVILVPNYETIEEFLRSGRVVDENVILNSTNLGSSKRHDSDTISRMNLKTRPIYAPRVEQVRKVSETAPPPTLSYDARLTRERLTLVWESKPLTRRDLTIPTGTNTHATGSMLLKKGAFNHIDQRHYFREEVFGNLRWHFDTNPSREHMERAEARFQFVIRNVESDVFTLRLSHNSLTDTRSYEQSNSMTQLHWGDAGHLVSHEDLLSRIMYLYRDEVDDAFYIVRID